MIAPSGRVGDCDDADPTVFPGKREDRDTRDDDCSGLADDTAACPCAVEHRGTTPYLFCTTGSDWAGTHAVCTRVGYYLADVQAQSGGCWNDYPRTCASGQDQPYYFICEG